MARTRAANSSRSNQRGRPDLSPENREARLISLAMDRAEEQLLNGTASSQVITHFLKLGTSKMELEKERLKHENMMIQAKTEALSSAKNSEELYKKAIKAIREYGGHGDQDEPEYDDY